MKDEVANEKRNKYCELTWYSQFFEFFVHHF